MSAYEPKHLHKMTPNWLFPYLVALDEKVGAGRWQYWSNILLDMKLPDAPIPGIHFQAPQNKGPREVIKHISGVLNYAERAGVRHSQAFEAFVIWLLHGLGLPDLRQYESPLDMTDLRWLTSKVLDAWYEEFNLGLMIMHPCDYMAYFAQGGANKNYNPYSGAGFFSTPMPVCEMMARMTFEGRDGDIRSLTVHDPCCGTGSLLLAASNYSLRLSGVDISRMMVLYTKLNMYLYAPWGVWWPGFSVLGGPNRQQLEEAIFGKPEPSSQPIMIQLPLFAPDSVPEPVLVTPHPSFDEIAVRKLIRACLERKAGIAA